MAPTPGAGPPAGYSISTAAEFSGVGLQTLRLYERRGLLTPARTDGGTRRYSDEDLGRLGRIADLVRDGVNLAGIAHILPLQDENTALRAQARRGQQHVDAADEHAPEGPQPPSDSGSSAIAAS